VKPNMHPQAEPAKVYLTLDRAAQRTGLAPATLKNLISAGEITAYRVGRRILRLDGRDVERITLSGPRSHQPS